MRRVRRIVCYAVNGSGLGHLTRLIAVGRWLRRYVAVIEDRPPEVLFLTSSEASEVLARAGFASFKIPSKTIARQAEIDMVEYRRLARQFVWQVLGVFNPDLFVVDTFPSGSFDELFQVLDAPFKKGFIFRNVKPEYGARPIFKSALGLYDTVVVPHGDRASFSKKLAPDIEPTFSGEVIQFERQELPTRDDARNELSIAPDQHLVYLSAGGGGDPDAEATLASLVEALRGEPDVHLLVGAGPLYHGRRLGGPKLTWFTAPDIWRYFPACDAAISAGGYNTFYELMYARVPSLFYAQEKVADDQALRIESAEKVGACVRLTDVSDTEAVRARLREVLDPAKQASMHEACDRVIAENGASRCALSLLGTLYDASQLAWARELLTPALVHALERMGNGSTTALTNWLSPLMPRGHVDAIAHHPAFESVIGQLSDEATREVKAILESRNEARERADFERDLIDLIHAVERTGVQPDAVRGTLQAAMKKHPLHQEQNSRWVTWICILIQEVRQLMEQDNSGLAIEDVLQLYRVFPRLVDTDARGSFELFRTMLKKRTSLGEKPHEIMQRIQAVKFAHSQVDKATLETLMSGAHP